MTEKKPEAGEFWEWAGCRLRVIGTRNNGAIVAEHECGSLEFGCVAGEMKHLPECDSFDWQQEPVESPDEWVTQDRVPRRTDVDQYRWITKAGDPSSWFVCVDGHNSSTHGHIDAYGSRLEVRCRRKDLPPLPQETPKREYVRLFCDSDLWLYPSSTVPSGAKKELKHDETGFYLAEVEK